MEERFMLFQEVLKEERADALVDALLIVLSTKGVVPEVCKEKIRNEKDIEVLNGWINLAAQAESVEMFLKEI